MNFNHQAPRILLLIFFYSLISLYIVYEQSTDANAVDLARQEVRHERMLTGDSEFFNPWQYRIFSTYSVELFYKTIQTVVNSIDRTKAFLLFRFLQNILIFFVADRYFSALHIRNPLLRLTGILIAGFCMAHSVFQSDLSFNTYFDILFYLVAAWLIIKERLIWIVPLTAMAALNRETSLLIPFMAVAPYVPHALKRIPKNTLVIAGSSLVLFVIVFVSVRLYYGYQPAKGIHGMSSFMDYLKFNLTFFRLYPELVGTFAFVPVVVIVFFKRLPILLKQWFWLICPAWFAIHLAYSTAVETRLFLVPQVLIFIPAFLWLIENGYDSKIQATTD